MWAPQSMVWTLWVVNGAPNRTSRMARAGVARSAVSVNERMAG